MNRMDVLVLAIVVWNASTLSSDLVLVPSLSVNGATADNCQGEGQIRLGQAVLARRQAQKFKLRGAVRLGEGLTVPGVEAQAVDAA